MVGSYLSGEWYGKSAPSSTRTLQEAAEIRRALGLEVGKKTAVIFSHIFWDGTFFYGTDLFGSYEEWFVETMKVACANPHVNWIVKIHPANIVKNVRDGVGSEPSELTAIRSLGEPLPPHVRVVQPDSRMSTLSLYSVMDYCVTVRGTVGIEAASFGIPVLTAGTGRYDRLGFTIDSESRAQYLDRLAHIHKFLRFRRAARVGRAVCPWGVHCAALQSAHGDVGVSARCQGELADRVCLPRAGRAGCADLRALADWIRSGRKISSRRSISLLRQYRAQLTR